MELGGRRFQWHLDLMVLLAPVLLAGLEMGRDSRLALRAGMVADSGNSLGVTGSTAMDFHAAMELDWEAGQGYRDYQSDAPQG